MSQAATLPRMASTRPELDRKSFDRDALIEAHLPLVRKLVSCLWRRRRIAGLEKEDLVQEGTIGLIKAIDTYIAENPRASLVTYITTCICNALRNALEVANVRDADALCSDLPLQEDDASTPDFTSHSDAKLLLETALPQLPDKTRQAIELVMLQELSKVEAARRMNITERHVARLVEQGKAQVRELLI